MAVSNPSEETERYWIMARNATTRNNQGPGKNCGKWLIFEGVDIIDEVWATVKRETEMGELGFASKVSTMRGRDERVQQHGSNFVICVYTYDHTDEADVTRVRERLRELGFSRKLPYKTDSATFAGEYSSTSDGRVSKHFC